MLGAKIYNRAHEVLAKAIDRSKLHAEKKSVSRGGKTFTQTVWKRTGEDKGEGKHAAGGGDKPYKPTTAGVFLGNLNTRIESDKDLKGRIGAVTMSDEDENSATLHYTVNGKAKTRHITGLRAPTRELASSVLQGLKQEASGADTRTDAEKKADEFVGGGDTRIRAAELGAKAHAAGKKAVPMHDAELMKLLKDSGAGKEVGGGSSDIMAAWLDGWHQANMDADVKKPVDKTNKPEAGLMHKFTANEKSDLINTWHLMRNMTKYGGGTDTGRHAQLMATVKGFVKEHPHISENSAYKRLTRLLEPNNGEAIGAYKDDEGAKPAEKKGAGASASVIAPSVKPDDRKRIEAKIAKVKPYANAAAVYKHLADMPAHTPAWMVMDYHAATDASVKAAIAEAYNVSTKRDIKNAKLWMRNYIVDVTDTSDGATPNGNTQRVKAWAESKAGEKSTVDVTANADEGKLFTKIHLSGKGA